MPSSASWRTPFLIIVVGCLIALLTNGPRTSMGLFLTPMSDANDWPREVFALALAIQNLLWGAMQPVFGGLADRYGTSKVLIVGALLYVAGLVAMAFSDTPTLLYLSAGVITGVAISAATFFMVITAFSRLLPEDKRLVGFGLATAAASMGQFIFAPLSVGFIDAFGWQTALILLAVTAFGIAILAPVVESRGSVADGPTQTFREAITEAFQHRSYVLLVFGFFVCGFHIAFITVHLPPYLGDIGLGVHWAAWAIAIVGLFNVIGSYGAGILSGRMPKQYLLSAIYAIRSVVILLFLLIPVSVPTVLLFSAAMGLLWLSTVPPTSGLVAVMFGTRYMGMLFGFVFFSHQVGAFIGVWLGGRLYDTTGSYDVVWWLSVALGLFAALVHWPIKEAPVERPQTA
ncbi:MAG: MFS transporter [Pseudomonadota bacterium]